MPPPPTPEQRPFLYGTIFILLFAIGFYTGPVAIGITRPGQHITPLGIKAMASFALFCHVWLCYLLSENFDDRKVLSAAMAEFKAWFGKTGVESGVAEDDSGDSSEYVEKLNGLMDQGVLDSKQVEIVRQTLFGPSKRSA